MYFIINEKKNVDLELFIKYSNSTFFCNLLLVLKFIINNPNKEGYLYVYENHDFLNTLNKKINPKPIKCINIESIRSYFNE